MNQRIAELETRMAAVEQRLRALEGSQPAEAGYSPVALEPTLGEGFVANASTHIGRVLLIFGGAFLLRAITDYQFVPTAVGIFLGATYAVFWLFMAWRTGRAETAQASAAFYGGTSVLLALPLAIEAITRFELLSGPQGIVALTIFSALAITVAAIHSLRSLAWLATGGGIGAIFVVLNASHAAVAASMALILLGLGILWAVYFRHWLGPQWLGAIGANVSILVLIVVSGSDQWSLQALTPFILSAILLFAYFFSFVTHSHARGKEVGIFEWVQGFIGICVAGWAAVVAVRSGQLEFATTGILCLVLGIGAYALAFTPETRTRRGRNFFFYSTYALLFVVAGTALVMSPATAAVLWSVMALVMAWCSGRYERVTLSLQCTFLLIAAGVASGLLTTGLHALAGDVSAAWPVFDPRHLVVALTTVACLFIHVAQKSERWGTLAGLPQLIVLALSVWEVGGLMVVVAAPLLASVASEEPNLAILAALRTAVLSASSVTLALSSRFRRWPEARWLVYPVLVLVGLKLFVEDFPHGQPASLFVSLAFVGGALLLVARLLNRGESAGLNDS
jgi:hypothetical protein